MNENSEVRASMADGRDADWLAFIEGSVIGTFVVGVDAGGKREEVTDGGRKFWVYVCAHARGIPHFHVYDKDGDPVEYGGKGGVHACVGLWKSEYCTHGPGAGALDQEVRAGLDRFMREVRTKGKYCCDVGKTNFFHTAAEWDDNNAPPGSRNWVDPETVQPDYATMDNRPDADDGRGRAELGLPECIRSFAVLPADRSVGLPTGADGEAQNGRGLEKKLREMHLPHCRLSGSHGGRAATFFLVFNIGLADADYLSHRYGARDFILAEVQRHGKIAWRYYQLQTSHRGAVRFKPSCMFVEVASPGEWPVEGHAVSLQTFSFRLPAACFERFAKLLESRCEMYEDYHACLAERIQPGIDGGGARKRMELRASIYGDKFYRFWDFPRNPATGAGQNYF